MSRCLRPVAAVLILVVIAGCSRTPIVFRYPEEHMVFPNAGAAPPAIFIDVINDMRPAEQREGRGAMSHVRFPGDDEWTMPVSQIYYEALVQDLTQTDLVELVPMRSQADYILEVDLLSLGASIKRSPGSFAMTAAVGAALGYIISQSGGGAAVGAVVGFAAVPAPSILKGEAEVQLRLLDPAGDLLWDRTCRGELVKSVWESVPSRKDQKWVDTYLTVAVKRCNACLLGQLRQALLSAGEER